MREPVSEPAVWTRRDFLRTSAAAGAALAAGGMLAACTSEQDARLPKGTTPRLPGEIASVAIHPSIGVARVGNSADSFYFGPEVPGSLPRPADGFKDPSGAIARQAARFRLYGLDAQGNVVRELTAADGAITWSASVANKKAAWYDYDMALDIPVAKPVTRRNAEIVGADRDELVVASGERSIAGVAASPVSLGGTFQGEAVPLGELMTDGRGRLVFLPAKGLGYSPSSAPLTTYSDNNGWADDICDGPVSASIDLAGAKLEAEPAWVVVTPANYGPGLATGLVTAYDSSRLGWEPDAVQRAAGAPVSFAVEILPIFARLVDMQWVNAGYLASNGWGSDGDFLTAPMLAKLADPSPANESFRTQLFERFRDPSYPEVQADDVPQIYGDGVTIPAQSAYQWLTVTSIQYAFLQRWARGDFVDDRAEHPSVGSLDELPLDEQPRALDRAGLESCLGGAYHPGIEVPWSLRVPLMWSGPLRLRVRSRQVDGSDYGDTLTPAVAMSNDGPLAGNGPGDLTRWQGVPWQSDAASCRSGYEPDISPVLPTFWPARIPNHVLREVDYRIVIDTTQPMEARQAAFERRFDWERFITATSREATLDNMMAGWFKLGLVTEQPGPSDGAFPRVMKVESLLGFTTEPTVSYGPKFQPESPEAWNGQPVRS